MMETVHHRMISNCLGFMFSTLVEYATIAMHTISLAWMNHQEQQNMCQKSRRKKGRCQNYQLIIWKIFCLTTQTVTMETTGNNH